MYQTERRQTAMSSSAIPQPLVDAYVEHRHILRLGGAGEQLDRELQDALEVVAAVVVGEELALVVVGEAEPRNGHLQQAQRRVPVSRGLLHRRQRPGARAVGRAAGEHLSDYAVGLRLGAFLINLGEAGPLPHVVGEAGFADEERPPLRQGRRCGSLTLRLRCPVGRDEGLPDSPLQSRPSCAQPCSVAGEHLQAAPLLPGCCRRLRARGQPEIHSPPPRASGCRFGGVLRHREHQFGCLWAQVRLCLRKERLMILELPVADLALREGPVLWLRNQQERRLWLGLHGRHLFGLRRGTRGSHG
mmetsp:Transcript_67848/g.191249  ORF Transcript_67848/g.191249 Transcript_67848/m.191249 type:complete len:302 (+) Transcript_67848:534-1439(+)